MTPELSSDAEPERFVSRFVGYFEPKRDDTAVILCHFSPAGFRRPAENARRVVSDMREAGIPVYSVELVRPGRSQELIKPKLVVEAESVMFHKENLLNLALHSLPVKYSKVVFLDADVRFNDRNWFNRTSAALDLVDVIQPMEWCFWSSTRSKISACEQLSRGRNLNINNVHPGFATAARRDWLDRVGGLYDLAVVGNGDVCFWHAIGCSMGLGFQGNSLIPYISKYENYESYVKKVITNPPRVASMRGCFAGHMPHGTAKNRQYLDRHKMFNSNLSVTRNKCGIYEWNDPLNNEIMLEYFKSRNEDNLTEQEFIKPHMDDKTFSLFASLVAEASNYVEYGCGGSTSYAFLNSSARIISVDTDKSWIDMVLNFMPGNLERVELCHIDMGEVGEWGFPKVETDGTAYVSWPWTRSNDADLILVDGRFRVACAVKSMIESKPGTPIIFEDYFGRNFYLGIEKLITPECRYGRSALFRVPASIDKNLAELILKKHIKDAR